MSTNSSTTQRRRPRSFLAALAASLLGVACSSPGDSTSAGVDSGLGGGGDSGLSSGADSGLGGVDGSTGHDGSYSADGARSGAPDAGLAADARGADVVNGGDGAPDARTSCVTTSTPIAIVQTATGCAFSYTGPVPVGTINLLLTPGWGTVCFAGSSGNCGTGSSADGWWFSGVQEIALCDATCTRFYNQTIAGKLTVQLGCSTQACMH